MGNDFPKKFELQSKGYVVKCETGGIHIEVPNQSQYVGGYSSSRSRSTFAHDMAQQELFSRAVYVTKEELEEAQDTSEADAFLNQTIRVLESKKEELMHYYMHYPLDDEEPPQSADFLAYIFLSRADRNLLLDDLAEEYPSVVARLGQRGARVYYYKQVLASIWPLIRTALIKWGAFGWVAELIRRMSS